MQLHFFESTTEAYASVQCDESVRTGDLLVIASERVVGIATAWPVAVSKEHGVLHCTADIEAWKAAASPKNAEAEARGMSAAIELARLLGW